MTVLNKVAINKKIFFLLIVSLSFLSTKIYSAELGEMSISGINPFLSSIPVCTNKNENIDFIEAQVVEKLGEDSFEYTDILLQYSFETFNDNNALLSINYFESIPKDYVIIVELFDSEDSVLASKVYNNINKISSPTSKLPCIKSAENKTEPEINFVIDTLSSDTWFNLAETINISWFKSKYIVEQVAVALYKKNSTKPLIANRYYPLPSQVSIPNKEFIDKISSPEIALATFLTNNGQFKVKKARSKDSKEVKSLQSKLKKIQEKLSSLSNILNQSKGLIEERNSEISTLRKKLVETRKRISSLEEEYKKVINRSILDSLNKSLKEQPIVWILIIASAFIIILLFSINALVRSRGRVPSSYIRYYDDHKKKIL